MLRCAVALTARGAFDLELRRAADQYFAERGIDERDRPGVYGKAIAMLAWLFGSWAWLVFATPGPVGSILLAVSIGLAHGGVGMGLTHDATHGALSRRRWINRAGATVLDLCGCSS